MRRTTPDHLAAGPPAAARPSPATAAPSTPSLDEVATLVDAVGRAFCLDDLPSRSTSRLREDVALLRRLEGLAAAGIAVAVRALADQGGVAEDGAPSTVAWVKEHTGRSARDANRTVRLGASLRDVPRTAEALASGAVTADSADTIARAVGDGRLGPAEEVEPDLLAVARTEGPEVLRAEVRRREQMVDAAAMARDEQRQHARRRFALHRRDDGTWRPDGLLPAETGERLRTLLDLHDHPDARDTPAERRRSPEQRLADALDAAVGVALDVGDNPSSGGIARPHVSVLVDLATFDADLSDPADPDRPVAADDPVWAGLPGVNTAWSGTLSPQAARRMCCDANVSRVVMAGESQILDVGRATRQWSAPQRRAIRARDGSCRGPSCDRPIGWTDIHHVQWWRHDGETNLDNGVSLCRACHRLVHEGGWHLDLDVVTAAVTWTSPDRRRRIVDHPRRPA